jgi:peroxiredoxin
MPLRRIMLGCSLVLACSAQAAERDPAAPINGAPLDLWTHIASDPTASPLDVGDRAPSFSYLDVDGIWHDSAMLFSNGPVLLVFAPTRSEIEALEKSRQSLADLGVSAAMVVDMRAGSAARMVRSLNIETPIIRDPVKAIAGLYGTLDPSSLSHTPGYFLVDKNRSILSLGVGEIPTPAQLIEASARALGRPLPETSSLPGS